ncbi:hypothetical protein BgiMline_024432 [Biomphalaria glabrata]|nr:hypothetical protein BgiMline_007640 [Biomphalaria glabrata]
MGSQDFVTSTVYGDTISFSEIMGSKYSVTGPYGHTFFFPDIMGSQDFVTSTVYGYTISFSEIMGSKYSVTGPYGHTFSFPRLWVVNTPSPGHMATLSPFPRSWVVNTPSLGHMATHSPFWISWAVKTPSPGHMATHSLSSIHGQSRLCHRAIESHTLLLRDQSQSRLRH